MILVFGYRTPAVDELGTILYHGDDRAEAMKIEESSDFPRIGRLDHPQVRPIKHWTEAASAAYEKAHAEPVAAKVELDDKSEKSADEKSADETPEPGTHQE